MVDVTLKQLDVWYNEPTQGGDRPKLLSKLAVIELCGWIEGEFDRLVMDSQNGNINDAEWVKANILERTNGFTYNDHLRPMLVRLMGEISVRRVEGSMEVNFPGELDQLRSLLGNLWRIRCSYAHSSMVANVAAQQKFDAPSWAINQFRMLKKLIGHFENVLQSVVAKI